MMLSDPPSIVDITYFYVSDDKKLVERFEKHLSPLKRHTIIAGWTGCDVKTNRLFGFGLTHQWDAFNLYLLLLSPDFLDSALTAVKQYIDYRKPLSSDRMTVVPILLSPALWQLTDFYKYEALPSNKKPVTSWSNRDEAFLDIALGIAEVVKHIMSNCYTRYIERYLSATQMQQPPGSSERYRFLSAEEKAICRQEADEVFQRALDIMKNINMELIRHAEQLSREVLAQPPTMPTQPVPPPSSPSSRTRATYGKATSEEEEEEQGQN